jgi:hypothetical protein
MDDSESYVFIISALAAAATAVVTRVAPLHGLFLRRNAGVGLARLAVAASMAWIAFVIWQFADPSVRGIYVVFYLVMGYAITKLFGQLGAGLFGARLRVDVYERRNFAAAVFVAAFTLATGMIFGGSLWGEADPHGGGEGGWWIPLGFFLAGWGVLAVTLALYLWREPGRFSIQIRQNRNLEDARTTGIYVLSTGTILTEGVAGDFFGWRQGLLGLAAIAAMLIVHELLAPRSPEPLSTAGKETAPSPSRRIFEALTYASTAIAMWLFQRLF